MKVQFVRTPGGEEMAVLARADYEELVARAEDFDEDAADIAMYDACKAENSPLLPPEVPAFMLRGDSLLRAVRKWRGVTQMEIEFKTGLSQGYLSDLETGRKKGTPETLAKLTAELEVPAAWFMG